MKIKSYNSTKQMKVSIQNLQHRENVAGDGDTSAGSIIASAKASIKKRLEAAIAATKHAEKLDAIVTAAEQAAEAVSQAEKIVSISDLYWRTDNIENQTAKDEPRKGPPRVSPREIPPALAEPRKLAAAGGNSGETVERNKSSSQLAEPRRSNRTFHPSSRLLEAMETSSIISRSPSTSREKTPRSQNRGQFKAISKVDK